MEWELRARSELQQKLEASKIRLFAPRKPMSNHFLYQICISQTIPDAAEFLFYRDINLIECHANPDGTPFIKGECEVSSADFRIRKLAATTRNGRTIKIMFDQKHDTYYCFTTIESTALVFPITNLELDPLTREQLDERVKSIAEIVEQLVPITIQQAVANSDNADRKCDLAVRNPERYLHFTPYAVKLPVGYIREEPSIRCADSGVLEFKQKLDLKTDLEEGQQRRSSPFLLQVVMVGLFGADWNSSTDIEITEYPVPKNFNPPQDCGSVPGFGESSPCTKSIETRGSRTVYMDEYGSAYVRLDDTIILISGPSTKKTEDLRLIAALVDSLHKIKRSDIRVYH